MSTDNKPITGWVVWHPFHKGFIRDSICEVFENIQGAEHLLRREINNRYLQADRWRIRPVEMRFTDTEKK